MKPPLRAGAARFPLWAAIAAEFGALAGQIAAQEPQWVWDVPWYRSLGVLAAYAVREDYSATHQVSSREGSPTRLDEGQARWAPES